MKFEIHKCTLNHLKAKLRKSETDDVDFEELDLGDFKTVDSIGDVDGEEGKPALIFQSNIIQKVNSDAVESDIDDEEFDSINETSPVGQEFVNKIEVNYCSLCREYLLRTSKDEKIISDHCKSKKHLKWFYQSKKKDENDRCAKLKENENELADSKEDSSGAGTSKESDKGSKKSDPGVKVASSPERVEKSENISSQKDNSMKETDGEKDAEKGSEKFKRQSFHKILSNSQINNFFFSLNRYFENDH